MPVLDLPDAEAWRAAVARVLKGADPATLVSRSRDGIAVAPLYGRAEPAVSAWRGDAAPVGIVQPVDCPDPDDAARLAALDAEGGATALTLVFAGTPAARGFGLSYEGAEAVLDAIDPARVTVRLEVPIDAARPALAPLLATCERRGVTLVFAGDPLAMAAQAGIADPLTVADGWLALIQRHGPAADPFRADGRVHHEAGASEAQELAAVLSTGVHYLRTLERAGLGGRRLAFTLAADADQLFTIAKLRALRRLWARVEQLCGFPPAPIPLHAETAWRMLARADPWTNILRNTIACVGAILGGADSVTILPFTAPLGLADAFARRLARNTPLVLLEEAGLGRVVDPLAGSGAIEAVTEALCQKAWALFQDLEREGGMACALAAGTWQERLRMTRQARADDLASDLARLVGVTAFRPPNEGPAPAVLQHSAPRQTSAAPHRFAPLPSIRDAERFEVEAEGV